MRAEYSAILDAGLNLQLDCPDLARSRHMLFTHLSEEDFLKVAATHVEAPNHALQGLPQTASACTSAGAVTKARVSATSTWPRSSRS
jgi:hypothetical protein